MALKFPDRLESNNPEAYGIIRGDQIAGSSLIKLSSDTSKDILYSDINDTNSVFGKGVLLTNADGTNRIGIISSCEFRDDGGVYPYYLDIYLDQFGLELGTLNVNSEINIGSGIIIDSNRINFSSNLNLSSRDINLNNGSVSINENWIQAPYFYLSNNSNYYDQFGEIGPMKLYLKLKSEDDYSFNGFVKIFYGHQNNDPNTKQETQIILSSIVNISESGFYNSNYKENAIFGNKFQEILPLSSTEIDNLFT